MPKKREFTRAQLDAAMEKAWSRFGRRENFTGVDIGYRYMGEEKTPELCVRIHVERKLPLETIPESQVFPDNIDGVPLDVIEGPYRATRSTRAADHQKRHPFVLGGVSCGRVGGGTGTIGAVVIDRRTGEPAILSNWHVLAGAAPAVGDPILQPGGIDGGRPGLDEIGRLERWMLGLSGDAAIAKLTGRRPWLPIQLCDFQHLGEVRASRLGEVLIKSGRSTGCTRARVDGEGIYRIRYEVAPGVVEPRDIRGFKLTPEKQGNPDDLELSSGGDSGSLWISPNSGDAVGLHFAGEANPNPAAEHAIACHLAEVLEELDVRLATFGDMMALEASRQAAASSARSRPAAGRRAEYSPLPDAPIPDWPYPDWPFPDWPRPIPPGGGWPWPFPRPPRPWPDPAPWPLAVTTRDPLRLPRRVTPRIGDIERIDRFGPAPERVDPNERQWIKHHVQAAFHETYGGLGRDYLDIAPSDVFDAPVYWYVSYSDQLEPKLAELYPGAPWLDDRDLTDLWGEPLYATSSLLVDRIAASVGGGN
ncbi:MAG: hypothetical protein AAFN79_20300 [Pseudomonadota bacterium]